RVPLEHYGADRVADPVVVDQLLSARLIVLAILDDALDERIDADASVASMLQFEMRVGDFPPVVLAADEIFRRDTHAVEEDGVFYSHHKVHVLEFDAGQIRGNMDPAEVFVALALRIGADERPEIIRRHVMADHDLLSGDDVMIAVADRLRLAVGDIASTLRLREHLPDRNFAAR